MVVLALAFISVACSKTETVNKDTSSYAQDGKITTPSTSSGRGTTLPAPEITVGNPPPQIKLEIPPTEGAGTSYSAANILSTDRMIIRSGNMDIVVEDVQTAIQDIASVAESLQGFVVNSTTWRSGNSPS